MCYQSVVKDILAVLNRAVWNRAVILGIGLILTGGCGPAAVSPTPSSPSQVRAPPTQAVSRPPPPATGFIGSQRCVECHADISATYAEHPMAHSSGLVTEVAPVENYEQSAFASNPWRYRAECLEEGVYHHEILPSPDDSVLYDHAEPVRYVIGSGRRGRTYVIDRDGFLFESPITWFSSGNRWDLSPGYARLNQHFERLIGDACLSCHVGALNSRYDQQNRYGEPMFLEAGIGCERCHGPAAEHVAHHAAHRHEYDIPSPDHDPIINPRNLDAERREAVCNQCHLQADERILRYGRRETDFRPGDALHDVWISFTRGTRVQDDRTTEVVSQVEQMHASRCYQASEGRFGCISCHDAHRVPKTEQVTDHYRRQCLNCHTAPLVECRERAEIRETKQNSCIACHMPKLPSTDVPHTAQTDHRVPRRPRNPTVSPGNGDAQFEVFGGALQGVPAWELQRARGLLMMEYAERNKERVLAAQALDLLKPIVDLVPDDAVLWTKLGVGYELANYSDLARQAWSRSMALDATSREPQRRLAILTFDRYSSAAALVQLEQACADFPWDARVLGRLIMARAAAGRFEDALELAQEGETRFPGSAQLHQWLANAFRLQGRVAESERHEKLARQLQGKHKASVPEKSR